jgi:hypothetical protein
MGNLTFDTYKFSKRLREAGATEKLAHTLTEVRKEALFEVQDMLAETFGKGAGTGGLCYATNQILLRKCVAAQHWRFQP